MTIWVPNGVSRSGLTERRSCCSPAQSAEHPVHLRRVRSPSAENRFAMDVKFYSQLRWVSFVGFAMSEGRQCRPYDYDFHLVFHIPESTARSQCARPLARAGRVFAGLSDFLSVPRRQPGLCPPSDA
ncbi:protein of unknown function [Cupriavidus taiwanensis]|uniref:Uncharacterized protein n=1 Tax=Cupriavidus taiwanensis TaxID=164546 RepID=A0A7Z7J680_9BURK|nr:hypothetical protein CBM2585_A60030 [Cupriavidus taiwanensis]SOY86366.1 protein of unknown function [Cupriavidus taiwanensis]SOZ01675.1 hypothetical protein CBM2595_A30515 [Cupriavidus taiwanensis]SPC09187.1 hypothetical protein CBM2594_A40510 [Cupriavidus taiwanensis]SPD38980.1 protein of unknown function [Cupriavidus taiwanensis]